MREILEVGRTVRLVPTGSNGPNRVDSTNSLVIGNLYINQTQQLRFCDRLKASMRLECKYNTYISCICSFVASSVLIARTKTLSNQNFQPCLGVCSSFVVFQCHKHWHIDSSLTTSTTTNITTNTTTNKIITIADTTDTKAVNADLLMLLMLSMLKKLPSMFPYYYLW